MRLARLLADQEERIVERWLELVRDQLDYGEASRPQLVDEVPQLLQEVRRRIDPDIEEPREHFVARRHGAQRRRIGGDATNLMREFGLVQQAVLDVAGEKGVCWQEEDYRALLSAVNEALVASVESYVELRDREMEEQAARSYAFVAHELRSPLQGALLTAEIIAARPERAEKKIQVVLRSLRQLRDLIDSTMTESRVRQRIEPQPEEFDAAALLREIAEAAEPNASGRGITIEANVPEEAPARWDRHLMRSALTNLVDNAVKFSRPDTSIQVRARLLTDREPEQLTVEVEDRCGGLPPELIDQIFEPFVRGASQEHGFGLGLRIARQAVEAHGGDLSVENLPGQGCVFTATVRRQVEQEPEPQS